MQTPSPKTVRAQAIARLQKRQGQPPFLRRGTHPAHPFNHLKNSGLIPPGWINQHRLRPGHAHRSSRIIRRKRWWTRSRIIAIENYSQQYRSLVDTCRLNKAPVETFLNCDRHLLVGVQQQGAEQRHSFRRRCGDGLPPLQRRLQQEVDPLQPRDVAIDSRLRTQMSLIRPPSCWKVEPSGGSPMGRDR